MKTLDRYIVRRFLTNMLLCLAVVISLRIVADLFINMDEFAKQELAFSKLVGWIGTYYAYHSLEYFAELGGVAIVMAAAFTIARMNASNELTAMMASGVSLRRVLLPIVICSGLMSVLVLVDRELVIPGPEIRSVLARDRDDQAGDEGFRVRLMADTNRSVWWAVRLYAGRKQMNMPLVVLRGDGRNLDDIDRFTKRTKVRDEAYYHVLYSGLGRMSGRWATPGRLGGRDGWFFTSGDLSITFPGRPRVIKYVPAALCTLDPAGRQWHRPPTTDQIWSGLPMSTLAEARPKKDGSLRIADTRSGLTIDAGGLAVGSGGAGPTLIKPVFTFTTVKGRVLGRFAADSATARTDPQAGRVFWELENGRLFYETDMTIAEMRLRESGRHLDYASSGELMELVKLDRVRDPHGVVLTRHLRMAEPLNNLVLLLVGVPFILSRERNVKASALMCLGQSLLFYAFVYASRYLGLPPVWSAWLPVLVFGPIAAMQVDAIKT